MAFSNSKVLAKLACDNYAKEERFWYLCVEKEDVYGRREDDETSNQTRNSHDW